MKVAIIVYSNDAETVWNAFRLANTTLVYEHAVTVFLLGKGIEAPVIGNFRFDVNEQMEIFRQSGGHLIGCGVCAELRRDVMPDLEQNLNCEVGSMQLLYALMAESDRVLTF